MAAPQLTVSQQGQGVVSGDLLNTFQQTCDTVAQLRAFVGLQGVQVFTRGLTAPGDGGQGPFWWNPSGTGPDDGVNIIVPPGALTGCWVRLGSFGNNDLIPCTATISGTQISLTIEGSYQVPTVPFSAPLFFAFIAPAAATGPFTLKVNGVNNQTLYDGPGGTVATGSMAQYQTCLICWNANINGGVGGYVLINPSLTSSQGGLQTGSLILYAGSASPSVPSGYLLCFGQPVLRSTYAPLFVVIGTTYGSGDGTTTFNVPDFRGRTGFGLDNMGGTAANRLTGAAAGGINAISLGAAGGEQAHTQALSELYPHTHDLTFSYKQNGQGAASGGSNVSYQSVATFTTAATGGGNPANVVNPGIAVNVLIKT